MGEVDRCITSGFGGCAEGFGFYSGCHGKPLEGFDLKLTCYTLLKDNSGCCLVGESVVVSGSWETLGGSYSPEERW